MTNLFSMRLIFPFFLLPCAAMVNAGEYPGSVCSSENECIKATQFTSMFSSGIRSQTAFLMNQYDNDLAADDFCKGLKKIIKESGTAFKDVRFNKKEDEDWAGSFTYDAKLPKLGFDRIRIFEEEAMKNKNGIKTNYSCMLASDINNRTEAESKYNQIVAAVTECVSKTGEAKKSGDDLQWFTVSIDENGQLKQIKITLTHYKSDSSLSLEVLYSSKE
jgi:hypothetical protein